MYVKSYWPEFPSLDEAYAFIQDRRLLVSDILDEVERENSSARAKELETSPTTGDRDENPVAAVSDDPPLPVRHFLPSASASDAPSTQSSNLSGECAACGEPYFIAQGRSGPIHCERCGEELFRSGG
jgi:hypothetical protein